MFIKKLNQEILKKELKRVYREKGGHFSPHLRVGKFFKTYIIALIPS